MNTFHLFLTKIHETESDEDCESGSTTSAIYSIFTEQFMWRYNTPSKFKKCDIHTYSNFFLVVVIYTITRTGRYFCMMGSAHMSVKDYTCSTTDSQPAAIHFLSPESFPPSIVHRKILSRPDVASQDFNESLTLYRDSLLYIHAEVRCTDFRSFT